MEEFVLGDIAVYPLRYSVGVVPSLDTLMKVQENDWESMVNSSKDQLWFNLTISVLQNVEGKRILLLLKVITNTLTESRPSSAFLGGWTSGLLTLEIM